MIKLGVNIDHVATLREARGGIEPDVLLAAKICEEAGAHGITLHLRQDRRHIQDADVFALREIITTRMNLEMCTRPEMVEIALKVRPQEICLVPETVEELTTEGGLDVAGQLEKLKPVVSRLRESGSHVSMFIDAAPEQIAASAAVGADCIELFTGSYAATAGEERTGEFKRLMDAAEQARSLGLQVNAGHGLNLENVGRILQLPGLDTLNIGHSIISHAVFVGLEGAVRAMVQAFSGNG